MDRVNTDAVATTPSPHANVGDQLCFALYAASRAVMNLYRTGLAQLGITYPQYVTMLAIWADDGSSLSQLGRALDLDSGTLSPILKRLSAAGFISKERSIDDNRTIVITCTSKGWELEGQAAFVRKAVEQDTGLSRQEFNSLRASLHSLRHNIESTTRD